MGDAALRRTGIQEHTVVHEQTAGRRTQALDVSGLPNGTYFLRLMAGGQTRTQKLTIAR